MDFKRTFIQILAGLSVVLSGAVKSEQVSVVLIPDTQMLVEQHPEVFLWQMNWIVANQASRNIIYVAHLGDLKDDSVCDIKQAENPETGEGIGPDVPSYTEWDLIDYAYDKLDHAGIPYGVLPGNHDFDVLLNGQNPRCPRVVAPRAEEEAQTPGQEAIQDSWTLTDYDDLFGPSTDRIANQYWYGDQNASPQVPGFRIPDPAMPAAADNSNKDNFTLFESCGIKFIAVNLGYRELGHLVPDGQSLETALQGTEIEWADDLLAAYPDRLAIVTSHAFMWENPANFVPDNPATTETVEGNLDQFNEFKGYGSQVYEMLKDNRNFMMMLSAHRWGEVWLSNPRTPAEGFAAGWPPVQVMMSDYQQMNLTQNPNPTAATFSNIPTPGPGNSGYMRIITFDTDVSPPRVNIDTFAPRPNPGDPTPNDFLDPGSYIEITSVFYPQEDPASIANPGLAMGPNTASSHLRFDINTYLDPTADFSCAIGGDTVPGAFAFNDLVDQPTAGNQWLESNEVIIGGIDGAAPLGIDGRDGGQYSLDSGTTWDNVPTTVINGQTIRVRLPRPPTVGTEFTARLNVGGIADSYSVASLPLDVDPDQFNFTDQSDVATTGSIWVESNDVTITGINAPARVVPGSADGGEFSLDGGLSWSTAADVDVIAGQSLRVRLPRPGTFSTSVDVIISIGTTQDTFTVTSQAEVPDIVPDPLNFGSLINQTVAGSAFIESAAETIGGINAAAPFTFASTGGGEYSTDGGLSWGSNANGSVVSGQSLQLRLPRPGTFSTTESATISFGSDNYSFTVTTEAVPPDPDPDPLDFGSLADQSVTGSAFLESAVETVAGINVEAPFNFASADGGEYSIDGGSSWSSAANGNVVSGQSLQLRLPRPGTFSTTASATISFGGANYSFTVTTEAQNIDPDSIDFGDLIDQAVTGSTWIESNEETISGINAANMVFASSDGGQYSLDGGATWSTNANTQVIPGQLLRLRLPRPASFSTTVSASVTIGSQGDAFNVTTMDEPVAGNAFSIVVIPNNKVYTERYPAIFEAQLQWVVDNQAVENIVYVDFLGDLKDDFLCDNKLIASPFGPARTEWEIVDDTISLLEFAATAQQPDGIPYGVLPGNHDFDPVFGGCPNYTTQRPLDTFNALLGPARFGGRGYFGGSRMPGSNEDNYMLFESGGVRFIAINLAFRSGANPADPPGVDNSPELTWADALLKAFPDRIGIVSSHDIMDCNSVPGSVACPFFGQPLNQNGSYGQQTYDRLSNNPNLMLMLSTDGFGEAYRIEPRTGMAPVHNMLMDYQRMRYPIAPGISSGDPIRIDPNTFSTIDDSVVFGDSGFMRIMRFDPATGLVDINTFSPPVPETPAVPGDGIAEGTLAVPARDFLPSTYFPVITGDPFVDDSVNSRTASNLNFSFTGYAAP